MDVQILCAAVQEAPTYLSRFTRKEYPLAFREYAERFAPVWTAAVRETAGEETALTVLADNFLEGLEQGWRRQRFWNRSSVRINEKQMVVSFLTPLLLGLEEPLCPEFAQILRDRWAARWPRDPYQTAAYADINSGFRYAIMGIPMQPPKDERQDP